MSSFLKKIKYSKLKGFWKKPDQPRKISTFLRQIVICSNYGMVCRSEQFYPKGNWRKFERSLVRKGWKVIGESILCPACYKRYLDER